MLSQTLEVLTSDITLPLANLILSYGGFAEYEGIRFVYGKAADVRNSYVKEASP